MAQIKLLNADCRTLDLAGDLIFTDPPFEMSGAELASILGRIDSRHLVLVTTMHQLLQFVAAAPEWKLSFDFVLDAAVPKKSKNIRAPHYTHATGVYMTRDGAPSRFDRKRRQRSDTFDSKGFWPTVLRAPRDRQDEHGMAKNLTAWTDILGSFDVENVVDPFAGSGTTGLAAHDLGIDCTMIERDAEICVAVRKTFRFLGVRLG